MGRFLNQESGIASLKLKKNYAASFFYFKDTLIIRLLNVQQIDAELEAKVGAAPPSPGMAARTAAPHDGAAPAVVGGRARLGLRRSKQRPWRQPGRDGASPLLRIRAFYLLLYGGVV
jgi:hypothetical protein